MMLICNIHLSTMDIAKIIGATMNLILNHTIFSK